jgi:hypothetical protein
MGSIRIKEPAGVWIMPNEERRLPSFYAPVEPAFPLQMLICLQACVGAHLDYGGRKLHNSPI